MTLEPFLNKASAAGSILRGRVLTWAYGIDSAGACRFGRSCVVRGGKSIELGFGVNVTDQTWLNVVGPKGRISIGDRVGLGRRTIISAALSVEIGEDTIFGPNVLVTDHNHESSSMAPVASQGITEPEPVMIGKGCWIGANVVILGGATIPDFCVVGANSVVTSRTTAVMSDGPARLLAGSPARVVK